MELTSQVSTAVAVFAGFIALGVTVILVSLALAKISVDFFKG